MHLELLMSFLKSQIQIGQEHLKYMRVKLLFQDFLIMSQELLLLMDPVLVHQQK